MKEKEKQKLDSYSKNHEGGTRRGNTAPGCAVSSQSHGTGSPRAPWHSGNWWGKSTQEAQQASKPACLYGSLYAFLLPIAEATWPSTALVHQL